jgi:hypothetical protein
MQTRNRVLNAWATNPDLKITRKFETSSWRRIHPESGTITGRVVQASLEYSVRKTYEVIIQEREHADNFRAMSVSNREMFQYITRAMLTGKMLRLEYIRLFSPHAGVASFFLNYMTSFRIVSAEILPD